MPRADPERLATWAALRAALARTERDLARRLVDERAFDLDVYRVLGELVAAGGQLRMRDLADSLVLGRPTTTRLVDRVEEAGLVRRERPADDGRAVFVVLTRSGREEYRRCQPAYERFVHDAFGKHLTDTEIATLARVAGKLPG